MRESKNYEAAAQAQPFVHPRILAYGVEDSVVMELEMPGVTRDKIEVTVDKDELTVTGWRTPDNYDEV
ncbi:MAG: Hsp20/alpha crystallin family protein [Candidatus Sumerlaeota bacterium]|nr:Hsp20/alpha crystallin family protein [Candidatus Sumerlaeota bacterium]